MWLPFLEFGIVHVVIINNHVCKRQRIAIFEILLLNERLKELIINRASTGQIREAAKEAGMRTLRGAGLFTIFDGVTTLEEIIRETTVME